MVRSVALVVDLDVLDLGGVDNFVALTTRGLAHIAADETAADRPADYAKQEKGPRLNIERVNKNKRVTYTAAMWSAIAPMVEASAAAASAIIRVTDGLSLLHLLVHLLHFFLHLLHLLLHLLCVLRGFLAGFLSLLAAFLALTLLGRALFLRRRNLLFQARFCLFLPALNSLFRAFLGAGSFKLPINSNLRQHHLLVVGHLRRHGVLRHPTSYVRRCAAQQ